jgi:raffinose/stachyose/melibiose transport system substrate-binding protein
MEMGMKLKLVVGLILLCGLAMGAASCGGGDGGSTEPSATSAADLSGTVTIWDTEYESFPEYSEAVDVIDARFEKLHPDVTIDRVAQPPGTASQLYRAAFTAHHGPDILVTLSGAAGVLMYSKSLEVLNDRISPELEENLTLWEGVTPGYTAEGDHYGIPIGLNGWVFYYNKKLFAKAGLPVDFEPKTWTELREAGETLKEAGIQPFTGGGKEGLENLWWQTVTIPTVNTPQEIEELANGEMSFTDEAYGRAFGPELEMHEAGLYPSDYFNTPLLPDGYGRFAAGEGAITLGFWNAIGYWGEFNPQLGEKNVGMFFAPGSPTLGVFPSQVYGITKYADNKDAAWAFLEYTASKEGIEILDEIGGFMPNRKDVSLPADSPIQADELMDASREQNVVLAPYSTVPGVVGEETMKQLNEVLEGRATLQEAQQELQLASEK